ncbi:MAG: OmpH family outer membrane protein [Planctomycetota bacterium]
MYSNVIKSCVVALVATVAMPLATTPVFAQAGGDVVVVLDVATVFKNNARFNSAMDQIQVEANALQEQVAGEQESIRQRAQEVSAMEPGPSRNQLEGQLEQEQASLRTKARQAEQELLNREAQAYYDTYLEMQNVVSKLAQEHGISLVLRFDSETIDRTNRGEVIKGVNRSVVFHRDRDLTPMVIQAMGPAVANAAEGGTQR